jgi:hypothetical protein
MGIVHGLSQFTECKTLLIVLLLQPKFYGCGMDSQATTLTAITTPHVVQ